MMVHPPADQRLEAAAFVIGPGRILADRLDVGDGPSRFAEGDRYHDSSRMGSGLRFSRGIGMTPSAILTHATDGLFLDPIELFQQRRGHGRPLRRLAADGVDRLERHATTDRQPVLWKRIDANRRQGLIRKIRRAETQPWRAERSEDRRLGDLEKFLVAVGQIDPPLVWRTRAPPGFRDGLTGRRDFEMTAPGGWARWRATSRDRTRQRER